MLSSSPILTYILIIGLSISSISCQKKRTADSNSEDSFATFSVKEMKGQSLSTEVYAGSAIPKSRSFNFESCLNDIYKRQPIVDRFFKVSGGKKGFQIRSDKRGCITWQESFDYDPVADARFIRIKRLVEGIDVHKGQRPVEFAINPWAGTVLDLAVQKDPPNLISESSLQSHSGSRRLVVTRLLSAVSVNQRLDDKQKQEYSFQLTISPAITYTDVNGAKEIKPLTGGDYEVQATLMHVMFMGEDQILDVVDQSQKEIFSTNNTEVVAQAKFKAKRIYGQGYLILGLKVKLVNGPSSLDAFQNLYVIGPNDQIESTKIHQPYFEAAKDLEHFDIANFIKHKERLSRLADKMGTRALIRKPGYIFTKIHPVPDVNSIDLDSSLTKIKHRTRFQTCVMESLNHDWVVAQEFEVKTMFGNKTQKLKPSNTMGCFFWEEEYEFDRYAPVCFRQYELQFFSKNAGVKETVNVSFNPWTHELVDNSQAGGPVQVCARQSENIYIDLETNYSSQTSITHKIEPNMSLSMSRKMDTRIPCKMMHPTTRSAQNQDKCHMGNYRIRYAIIRGAPEQVLNTSLPSKYVVAGGTTIGVIPNPDSTIAVDLFIDDVEPDMPFVYHTLIIDAVPLDQNLHPLTYVKIKPQYAAMFFNQEKPTGSLVPIDSGCSSQIHNINNRLPCLSPEFFENVLETRKKRAEELKKFRSTKFGPLQVAERENIVYINYNKPANEQKSNEAKNLWTSIQRGIQQSFAEIASNKNQPAPQLTSGHLDSWIQKRDFHSAYARGLCNGFFDGFSLETKNQLSHFCLEKLREYKDPNAVFLVTYHYYPDNPQIDQSSNPQITHFSLTRGVGYSLGADFSRQDGKGIDYGLSGGANIPVRPSFMHWNVFQTNWGWKRSWNATKSDRAGVSTNINLNPINQSFQQIEIPLRYDQAEHCAVIQFQAGLIRQLDATNINREIMQKLPFHRAMLCPGKKTKQNIRLAEKYFLWWEDYFQSSTISDPRNPNYRESINFRGQTDLLRLISLTEDRLYHPLAARETEISRFASTEVLANSISFAPAVYPGELVTLAPPYR